MIGGRSHVNIDKIKHLSENTKLSPYIKFGCYSIREIIKIFSYDANIIRNLIWRDFYSA